MGNISKLERRELNAVYENLKLIEESHDKNSDSIADLIFEQLDITVSDDDRKTFEIAIAHCKLMVQKSRDAKARLQILIEHFNQA